MPHSDHSQAPVSAFTRLHEKWKGNLRFRHTFLLSGIILIIMVLLASIMLAKQRSMLYHAAETKGLAFTQAFAIGGWAAIQDNLYRIQEALMSYPEDPDILGVDIIDNDNMVMASQLPSRIGLILNNPEWLQMKHQREKVVRYTDNENGTPPPHHGSPTSGPRGSRGLDSRDLFNGQRSTTGYGINIEYDADDGTTHWSRYPQPLLVKE